MRSSRPHWFWLVITGVPTGGGVREAFGSRGLGVAWRHAAALVQTSPKFQASKASTLLRAKAIYAHTSRTTGVMKERRHLLERDRWAE